DFSLAGSHELSGATFEGLYMVKAFRDCPRQVRIGDVHTQADDPLTHVTSPFWLRALSLPAPGGLQPLCLRLPGYERQTDRRSPLPRVLFRDPQCPPHHRPRTVLLLR